MKKISFLNRQLLFDYALTSIASYILHILMVPFSTRAVLLHVPNAYFWLAGLIPITFLSLLMAEGITSRLFHLPADYSRSLHFHIHRLLCLACCVIVISTFLFAYYYIFIWHGWGHWHLLLHDQDGQLSFSTLSDTMKHVSICVLFFYPVYLFVAQTRIQRYQIEELQELNQLLETEQRMLRQRLPNDNVTDKVILHGDSRESLIVNPQDILYVESVANYLNIVYFNDSDLCQKRLRCSLKDTEDALDAFPFLVHIHRAFLVNINFITQISGNAAGYKLSLFSTDKILPVSKSNIAAFKEKIGEMGAKVL